MNVKADGVRFVKDYIEPESLWVWELSPTAESPESMTDVVVLLRVMFWLAVQCDSLVLSSRAASKSPFFFFIAVADNFMLLGVGFFKSGK